jgi:hypothetical protein
MKPCQPAQPRDLRGESFPKVIREASHIGSQWLRQFAAAQRLRRLMCGEASASPELADWNMGYALGSALPLIRQFAAAQRLRRLMCGEALPRRSSETGIWAMPLVRALP